MKPEGRLERIVESLLWRSRLGIIVAVLASVLVAFGTLFMATVDAVLVLQKVASYASPSISGEARADLRAALVTGVVKAVDGYLIAAIMFIFALGMYVIFVSRIEAAEQSESAPNLLRFATLDDLKDRLAKVVLLVLVIEFFQAALKLNYGTPLDLLQLAVGIVLVAFALYLSGHSHAHGAKKRPKARRPAASARPT